MDAKTLAGVFADIDPSIRRDGVLADDDPRAEGNDADTVTMFATAKGKPLYVFETRGEVWIDVSRLDKGDGGNAIYSAISEYALNTGKVFIGDPEGLSVPALRRRTDNMLSTALKHGTTRHIAPHPYQIEGDARFGVPGLRWTEGDDVGNLSALIDVSIANLVSLVPEVADARYDFNTGTFRTGEGQPLTDGDLERWSSASERNRAPSAGRRTLKRGILLNTLARAEVEDRPGLLERSLRQPRQLVTRGGLARTFYQTPPRLVREAAAATEEIRRLMPALRAELDRLDLKRVRLSAREGKPGWQGAFHVTGDGEMEIVIGASLDPMRTLHHEVIHALRAMNLFTPEEWRALSLAAEKRWMAEHNIAARYPDLSPEQQIEEAIAEAFSAALAARQSPRGSILVRAFNKIARVLRAFRTVMTGRGYDTPEAIFGAVLAGEISARARFTKEQADQGVVEQRARWRDSIIALAGDRRVPEALTLGAVPAVLRAVGGKGRVLIMHAGKAKTVMRKHRDLPTRAWLDLPDLIARPAMVIDNTDGTREADILVVTTMQSDDGRHVVAAIKTDGVMGRGQQAPATVVVTFYPKDRLSELLAKAQRENLIRYVGARREGQGYGRIGADSRSGLLADTIAGLRANPNILTPDDVFKPGGPGFKEQRQPLAVRPLTPQGRAHRNSAMGPTPFIPDRRVWETLTAAGVPVWRRLRDMPGAAMDAVDRARYTIQDRMVPFLRAQEAVERQIGRKLGKAHDVYTAETTFSGKVGRHLLEIDEEFTKPIIGIIAASKGRMI